MFNILVLSENRSNGKLEGEFGLSLLVNFNGYKFLFDTGASDLFIRNAKAFGIDVDIMAENVIISHGHSDHTNGLKYLKNAKRIILHPSAFKMRYSMRQRTYSGFPMSEQSLKNIHNVYKTKDTIEVMPNLWYLGEIPMTVDFEKDGNFATTLDEAGQVIDKTEDDSAVVASTGKGLIILVGCGHRGICNIIEYAKKVTGQEQVYAVLGGFHMRGLGNKAKIDKTIEYFKKNRIRNVYLGHCVTDDVIDYFEENLTSSKIFRLAVGKKFYMEKSIEENLAEKL
ncbi:MAG: MBL fold metallo-hydrolase [Clostridia bacterium]|nr:MBL fold metallo-hydrolase [Clostridia bacterium]